MLEPKVVCEDARADILGLTLAHLLERRCFACVSSTLFCSKTKFVVLEINRVGHELDDCTADRAQVVVVAVRGETA
jgi:hypothetical protein